MRLCILPSVLGAVQRIADIVRSARQKARFRNSAMIGEFAVPVRETLPRIERGQGGRFQRRDVILDGRKVGDTRHPYAAIVPGQAAKPFDRVGAILGFLDAVVMEISARKPRTARIGDGHAVTMLSPPDRIGPFEGRKGGKPVGIDARARPEDLIGQGMLPVGAPCQQDRHVAFRALRAIKVAEDFPPVAQRYDAVALDHQSLFHAALVVWRRQRRLVCGAIGIDPRPHQRLELRLRHQRTTK